MMRTDQAYQRLRLEIARIFPNGEPVALTHALTALEGALATPGEARGPLDLLEDLLEAALREAGWPRGAAQ